MRLPWLPLAAAQALWLLSCTCLLAQNVNSGKESFSALNSADVEAQRSQRTVFLNLKNLGQQSITIPRLAAPMRSIAWKGHKPASRDEIKVTPEQTEWLISWKEKPQDADTLVLRFGTSPKLLSETKPIHAQADGSYLLPAHRATVDGEKVRYEPQPYKNTVGYWTGARDQATWNLDVEQPGTFNVAILQGCGKGQGGSQASITMTPEGADASEVALDFEVLETGHFQNFQWRQLGTLQLQDGKYTLTVSPKEIANKALMDVRAIHLVRLPD